MCEARADAPMEMCPGRMNGENESGGKILDSYTTSICYLHTYKKWRLSNPYRVRRNDNATVFPALFIAICNYHK